MSSKIKSLVHISQKSLKSKNKDLIDKLIKYYQDKTKSAVEKIIDMFVAIQVVDSMFNSGEITKDDMNYFFAGISMNPKSSAFRKSMCIAAKANILKKYIEYLPTASSVIFEITTLNQDVFQNLIENGDLHTKITLDELKKLTKKVPSKNKSLDEVSITITLARKKIANYSMNMITDMLRKLIRNNDFLLS